MPRNYDDSDLMAAMDEDTGSDAAEDTEFEKKAAVKKCSDWFESDRTAKAAIMEEFEELDKLYRGDHWDLKGPTGAPLRNEQQKKVRPCTVENMTQSLVEGLVGEFSEQMDLVDYPVESGDDEAAGVMTDLKEFIAYKNRLQVEREKWLRQFFHFGTGIWHIYWDPHWKGGRGPNRWQGDVRWKAIHPQAVFPDARCRDSIEDGRRIHKAFYFTQESVAEKWGIDPDELEADMISSTMLIGDYSDGEVLAEIGEEQVLVVETWYKGKPRYLDPDEEDHGPGMHIVWWAGEGGKTYLAHSNYVYYDPGEDARFPFIFRQRYPRANSVWGYGEAHYLKSPNIVLNKTSELILESHMHEALGQTFFEEGALTPKQREFIKNFGTLSGMHFEVKSGAIQGQKMLRLFGKSAPGSLGTEAGRLQKTMESQVGRFDVSQGKTPGGVTAFRALDLLAARAQVRLRSAETAMISSHEDCGNYINNLINKFYTEKRAYRILGDDIGNTEKVFVNTMTGEEIPYSPGMMPPPGFQAQEKKTGPRYGLFEGDKLKKVYFYEENQAAPYSEFVGPDGDFQPPLKMSEDGTEIPMVEGEDFETYSPAFDVICKVSTTMPSDRAFYMEMAKELYAGERISGKIFWYVLKHGKFPPFEDLMQEEEQKEQMAQQQAMMQQQQVQPNMGAQQQQVQPGDMAQVEQVLAANPELAAEFVNLSSEQQQAVINQITGVQG